MSHWFAAMLALLRGPQYAQAAARLGVGAALLKSLGAPLFIVMVLAMMVLPLPPFAGQPHLLGRLATQRSHQPAEAARPPAQELIHDQDPERQRCMPKAFVEPLHFQPRRGRPCPLPHGLPVMATDFFQHLVRG